MSFILRDSNESIQQLDPPCGSVSTKDFEGIKYNLRIVEDSHGSINGYVLNVPLCISLVTVRHQEGNRTISQTTLGANGHHKFERTDDQDQIKSAKPKMHKHDYSEMVYIIDGEIQQYIEDNCYTYSVGQACLLNSNTHHGELFKKDCRVVYICFSKEQFIESLENNLIKKKAGILYDFISNYKNSSADYLKQYLEFMPVKDNNESIARINVLIDMLCDELLEKKHGQTQMVKALLVRLFSSFLDYPENYFCRHVILDTKSDSYIFNQISKCIEQCSGRPTRHDLEQNLGYCGDYINRIVKKNSGMSLFEYIRTINIKKAEQLLKHTDESITAITSLVGFESKTYFYKLFKSKHGITPLEYRAKFR